MSDTSKRLATYRKGWAHLVGPEECLNLCLKDLAGLEYAIERTRGREVAVQAGGHLGMFPKRLAEQFASVYTFEPDAKLFAMLERNAPEKNITPVRAALGNAREPVSLACYRRNENGKASHLGLTHVAGGGTIPQVLLDDLNLHACDLIYLDVEGYEMNALLGAQQTVAKFHPVIGFESGANHKFYGSSRTALAELMAQWGYTLLTRIRGDDIYGYGN